jgi:hypothetical protein
MSIFNAAPLIADIVGAMVDHELVHGRDSDYAIQLITRVIQNPGKYVLLESIPDAGAIVFSVKNTLQTSPSADDVYKFYEEYAPGTTSLDDLDAFYGHTHTTTASTHTMTEDELASLVDACTEPTQSQSINHGLVTEPVPELDQCESLMLAGRRCKRKVECDGDVYCKTHIKEPILSISEIPAERMYVAKRQDVRKAHRAEVAEIYKARQAEIDE